MKIMLCVDFSDHTQLLLREGINMAQKFDAELFVTNVILPSGDVSGGGIEVVPEEYKTVSLLAEQARAEGIVAHAVLLQGIASNLLSKEAEKIEADMIIVGTHGKGMVAGTLLGSVSQSVIKATKVPVYLVPTL